MRASTPKTRQSRRKKDDTDPKGYGALFHWTDHGFATLTSKPITIMVAEPVHAWGSSLGVALSDRRSIIKHVKEGLNIRSFDHLCRAMGISPARLAAATGIAARTLDRRKKEGRLQRTESERVFRLAALFEKAVSVLGDAGSAQRWFNTPLQSLGGQSPLEYSDTEIGAREIEDLLGRLEHGVFS